MEINLKDFSLRKPEFMRYYHKHGEKLVAMYCACNSFPLVVAACFILEVYPDDEYALDLKQRMIEFYEYKRVY